jgi:hypothetical protein
MKTWNSIKTLVKSLDKAVAQKGYFTSVDIQEDKNVSQVWKNLIVFILKRSHRLNYCYVAPSGQKFDYKFQAPKSARNELICRFEFSKEI